MKSIRIQLTENSSVKKPKASTIIVVNKYEDLVKLSCSKFKINPKKQKIRFFIAKEIPNAKIGTEIKNEEDYSKYIINDIMLAISNGEAFKGKSDSNENYNPNLENKINRPPRHPYPFYFEEKITDYDNINDIQSKEFNSEIPNCLTKQKESTELNQVKEVKEIKQPNSIFPILEGNVLNLIEKSIESNPKIKAFEQHGYISFDYQEDAIFSDIKDLDNLIQRECRGLIISSTTGKVLARRFHKFFNIDEREETLLKNINLTDAIIQEKLDGSIYIF